MLPSVCLYLSVHKQLRQLLPVILLFKFGRQQWDIVSDFLTFSVTKYYPEADFFLRSHLLVYFGPSCGYISHAESVDNLSK